MTSFDYCNNGIVSYMMPRNWEFTCIYRYRDSPVAAIHLTIFARFKVIKLI